MCTKGFDVEDEVGGGQEVVPLVPKLIEVAKILPGKN